MAILLVEQKVAIPVSIGQRIYVVDHGTIGWSGTTAEFDAARADIETKLAI
jgi:ABC-type branched-subunit amino acid transport system ATPase component